YRAFSSLSSPFFFTPPATPDIYTLSLHDALPISRAQWIARRSITPALTSGKYAWRTPSHCPISVETSHWIARSRRGIAARISSRSEEHTSELQSLTNLVCRLLLDKKNHPPSHHPP